MGIIVNNSSNSNTISTITHPNVLFFEIPETYISSAGEEVLALTIENWSELLDTNGEILYDFFICSNAHWANSWQEGSKFEKININTLTTYQYYSNGPESYSNSIKITDNGEIYVTQSGWSSSTTLATNIIAIRKISNTISSNMDLTNYATKDDIINLINSISESEY